MKKETRNFLIILLVFLFVFNLLILTKVHGQYVNTGVFATKSFITGSVIYSNPNSTSMFGRVIGPLLVFNGLIILFLNLSHYNLKHLRIK